MEEFLASLHPAWLALIRVLLLVAPILVLVPGLIWWERRLLSWMQDRIGPNRVGPFGLLQPIADGVKLFFKEDITPKAIDGLIYFFAPAIALFPSFALGATMPWGPGTGVYGMLTPVADVNIGVLYILAISSLGVYGIVLAGYASNNKYSLMGGLRSSAQLISYELAMGMALAAVVLATGSLKLTEMVKAQEAPLWSATQTIDGTVQTVGGVSFLQIWFIFTPWGFIAAIVFAICVIAETNRAPFDLPEAENELIAGYHTEYSSMKFAVFFMGEYAAMFVFSGVFATVFLGGYNLLPLNWSALGGLGEVMAKVNYWGAPLWFIGKCAAGITLFIWLRATLPRLRYDQLMSLGWRSLLPLALVNFLIAALWIVATEQYGYLGGLGVALAAWVVIVLAYQPIKKAKSERLDKLESRSILMVDPSEVRP